MDPEVHGFINDNLFIPIQDLEHTAVDAILMDAGRAKERITCKTQSKMADLLAGG